jgi:hypothetical protein
MRFIEEIHSLNYFSLSFPDKPKIAAGLIQSIQKRLERPGLSEAHIEALKYKLQL